MGWGGAGTLVHYKQAFRERLIDREGGHAASVYGCAGTYLDAAEHALLRLRLHQHLVQLPQHLQHLPRARLQAGGSLRTTTRPTLNRRKNHNRAEAARVHDHTTVRPPRAESARRCEPRIHSAERRGRVPICVRVIALSSPPPASTTSVQSGYTSTMPLSRGLHSCTSQLNLSRF